MAHRGRLIQAFLAEIYRLDREAMGKTTFDGHTHKSSGLDPDFREPILVDPDGDGQGEPLRLEMAPVMIPCQIEPKRRDILKMMPTGETPRSKIELVFHMRDLERKGLVDPVTGNPLLQKQDRLAALLTRKGHAELTFHDPPGLYATEITPAGWGLHMGQPRLNLLMITFEAPQLASRRLS